MSSLDPIVYNFVNDVSPIVASLIKNEAIRQQENIELIASENYPSDAVRATMASCLTAKYAEGYPECPRYSGRQGRYYGGCQVVDQIEEYCCNKWRKGRGKDYRAIKTLCYTPKRKENCGFSYYKRRL